MRAKRLFSIFAVMLMVGITARIHAENSFYVDGFSVDRETVVDVAVNLTNDVEFTAFQADITLPAGLSFVENAEHESYFWLDESRKSASHTLTSSVQNNNPQKRRIFSYSGNNAPFKLNSGALVYFQISVGSNFSGTKAIELTNVVFTQADATEVKFEATTATVSLNPIKATSISLDSNSLSLETGNTATLTATVLPTDATDRSVVWKSSNASVAKVDTNGKVTALSAGSTEITATTADGSNLVAVCAVDVKINLTATTRFYIKDFSIAGGETLDVAIVFENEAAFTAFQADVTLPAGLSYVKNEDYDEYFWLSESRKTSGHNLTSSNPNQNLQKKRIISISNEGSDFLANSGALVYFRVTAAEDFAGPKTISLTNVVFTQADATECKVAGTTTTVSLKPTLAESVSLSSTSLSIERGKTATLTATVLPTDTTDRSVVWKSSNTAAATVDENGVVTAIAVGKTNITATTADGSNLVATCEVIVKTNLLETTRFYIKDFSIKAGETVDVAILFENVAEFTAFQADITLPVGLSFVYNNEYDEYFWLEESRKNAGHTLTSSNPNTNQQKKRLFSYSANSLPYKSNSGALVHFQVTAGANFTGTKTILLNNVVFTQADATQCELEKTITTVSLITTLSESISLDKSSITLEIGDTSTLSAVLLPTTTTTKSVTWESSNETVVTVDSNGILTAIAVGNADITATTTDGTLLSATCQITVTPELLLGDSDGDGSVTLADVINTLNYFLEISVGSFVFKNADINGDGVIDLADIVGTNNIYLSVTE